MNTNELCGIWINNCECLCRALFLWKYFHKFPQFPQIFSKISLLMSKISSCRLYCRLVEYYNNVLRVFKVVFLPYFDYFSDQIAFPIRIVHMVHSKTDKLLHPKHRHMLGIVLHWHKKKKITITLSNNIFNSDTRITTQLMYSHDSHIKSEQPKKFIDNHFYTFFVFCLFQAFISNILFVE